MICAGSSSPANPNGLITANDDRKLRLQSRLRHPLPFRQLTERNAVGLGDADKFSPAGRETVKSRIAPIFFYYI